MHMCDKFALMCHIYYVSHSPMQAVLRLDSLGLALAYQQSDVLRLPIDLVGCTSFGFAVVTNVPCVGPNSNLHSPEFRC